MRIVITGGTGLIGSALCDSLLASDHEVVVLSRNPNANHEMPSGVQLVEWDAVTGDGWLDYLEGADAVVNLAGENLADGLWTATKKKRIRDSRINAGKAVVDAVRRVETKPHIVVQASGVDYYGARGDEEVTENSRPGESFLAQLCLDWEASTAPVEEMGVKRAIIRTGLVLSRDGGALPRLLLPFKLFVGGPMGSGHQYWPWIHIDDEIRAIRFLIDNSLDGPFNLTAPNPLTNRDFAKAVGSATSRPAFMPVPGPALKLVLGEMSTVLLEGRKALPAHLLEHGFEFQFPTARSALQDLVG